MSRQQQKQATARRIFEAALELFTEQGFAATTVEQITRAAGVAKGTFFTHFANKEAVLEHIGQVQLERLAQAFAADPTLARLPAPEQLHAVLRTLADGIANQPAEMRALTVELLMRQSLFDVDRQGIHELDTLLERIIAAGQARGDLRADAPPRRLALLVRGAYFLAFFEWVQADAADLPALVEHYLDLLLRGIQMPDT
jgi:AcrR family transcriptional regulator